LATPASRASASIVAARSPFLSANRQAASMMRRRFSFARGSAVVSVTRDSY
jgi:hypothetical protein